MQILNVTSPSTMVSYCKALKIQKGLKYFTQYEHDLLVGHRRKMLRGGEISESAFEDETSSNKCA
jgi:hypothetical protein